MKRKVYLFIIVALATYGSIILTVKSFQMYYQNREYPMWQHVQKICEYSNSDPRELIVIGDSRTKACFIPDNDKQFNLSLGGATPLEGYFTLKYYLENNAPPQKILVSYAPLHFVVQDSFFGRTIAFDYLTLGDLLDVMVNDVPFAPKYFRKSILEALGYVLTPWYYIDALGKGLATKRWVINKYTFDLCRKGNGHFFFNKSGKFKIIHRNLWGFRPSTVSTKYVNKILALLKNYPCELYYFSNPYSYVQMKDMNSFITEYNSYIHSHFKNVLLPITFAPTAWFGDPSHLWKGSKYFTDLVILKLRYFERPYESVSYSDTNLNEDKDQNSRSLSQHGLQLPNRGIQINFSEPVTKYDMDVDLTANTAYYIGIDAGKGSYGILIDKIEEEKNILSRHHIRLAEMPFRSITIMPIAEDGEFEIGYLTFN